MNKNCFVLLGLFSAGVVLALPAAAQTNSPSCSYKSRFGLSYRAGFNIHARFSDRVNSPGPGTGGGLNRTYDDGYNWVDISDNAGGMTWNWGYQNASQVQGDTLVMHSALSTASVDSEDAQHGFELTYNLEIGHLGNCPWGLEAAFNFTDVTIHGGMITSDAYALNGVTPPLPPYAGSFSGDPDGGTLIGDSPTRMVMPGGAFLDASIYGWRVGPYLQIPLSRRFSFSVSGGLALALVDSAFSYHDFRDSTTRTTSDSGFLVGGYAGGTFSYAVSTRVNVFAGAQYQNVGTFTQSDGRKSAALDLSESVFVTLGLGVNF